jgi:hypothetical protein
MPDKHENNKKPILDGKESEKTVSSGDYAPGMNPNSLKNLKPWTKGVSGNPGGRAANFDSIKSILKEYGMECTYDCFDTSQGTRRDQVLEKIWSKAMSGDLTFIKLLAGLGCLDEPR